MLDKLILILTVTCCFGLLILVHELGHFLVAKAVGIYVETFSIGFGPTLISFQRKETEYRIAALPLGGYVKMAGQEDYPGQDDDEETDKPALDIPDDQKYHNKTGSQRAAVIVAGAASNFVLGFLLMTSIYVTGVEVLTSQVGKVLPNAPAMQAGVQAGDRIVAINGQTTETWEAMSHQIRAHANQNIQLEIARGDRRITLDVTPENAIADNPDSPGRIGISPGDDPQFNIVHHSPLSAMYLALDDTVRISVSIYKGLWLMASGQIKAEVAGPVGILKMTGEKAQQGLRSLLFFMALLSINLGALNLLPIPVLDGGHLLFIAIEGIIGRSINIKIREISQTIGAALLLTLMVFATYKDIARIFLPATPPAIEQPAK